MNSAIADVDRKQGIQSLEIGVRIFQAVHRLGRAAKLSELAKLSGMPPSKVHRYCVSLVRTELLQRDSRGLYGVGPFGFRLGIAASALDCARDTVIAALPRLVDELHETVFVSAWGSVGPRILHVADADKPISIRPNVRHDLPLHDSATGRVFAAYLLPAQLDGLLAAEFRLLRQAGKLSAGEMGARRRALARQLTEVRRRGLARTVGERHAGLNSFAAPIFGPSGNVILALTSFGLATDFSSSWDGRVARTLRSTAIELTKKIGGVPAGRISG